MQWLIGKTGYSLIDVWSLAHLGFWIFVGSTLWAVRVNRVFAVLCCLSVAVSWEIFERFAEKLWPKIWLSPESWWNAWASDILTCFVGVLGMYLMLDRWGGRQ